MTPELHLLGTAEGDRLEALYVLSIHTGMRQGEFLGLKWEDIDLDRPCGYAGRSPARVATAAVPMGSGHRRLR